MSETSTSPIEGSVAVVCAYVAHNSIPSTELPGLIASVHAALAQAATGIVAPSAPAVEEVEQPTPAQIRKSITNDALISFIDGQPYKTLKRHLTKHGLEPGSYRKRYGLPVDYPMTAPSYSAARSDLAKASRLGHVSRPEDAA